MPTIQDAIKLWRDYTGRQAYNTLIEPEDGSRCALGVLAGDDLWVENKKLCLYGKEWPLAETATIPIPGRPAGLISQRFGFSVRGACRVQELNDETRLSLEKIADYVESHIDEFAEGGN